MSSVVQLKSGLFLEQYSHRPLPKLSSLSGLPFPNYRIFRDKKLDIVLANPIVLQYTNQELCNSKYE